MQARVQAANRTETGISELDIAISGGFPAGSAILVNGGPGTGKTILGLTFLWNGLNMGESGIYVSFGEGKKQTYANMKEFGMNFKKFEDEGRFTFLEMLAVTETNMADEVARISGAISRHKARRAVIDSFSAINEAFGDRYVGRQVLQTVVQKLIRSLGCTTLIISERPFKTASGFIPEGFLADGIISLTDGIPRKLEIHKMRGTRIVQRELLFTVEGKLDVTRTILKIPEHKKRWRPTLLDGDMISTVTKTSTLRWAVGSHGGPTSWSRPIRTSPSTRSGSSPTVPSATSSHKDWGRCTSRRAAPTSKRWSTSSTTISHWMTCGTCASPRS